MRIAAINVTPLIDVMLVLLILFMLITPRDPRRLNAALPQPGPGGQDSLSLVLTVDTAVYALNQTPVTSDADLDARLREAFASGRTRTLFVEIRGEPSYGRVVEAMDIAQGAGADRIGLRATALKPPAAPPASR